MRYLDERSEPLIGSDEVLSEMGWALRDQNQDTTMMRYIDLATDIVETACARPVNLRRAEFHVGAGRWSNWYFPVAPVSDVERVEATADHATWEVIAPRYWVLARQHDEPRLILHCVDRRIREICVTAAVGQVPGAAPTAMKAAVKLIAKSYFEADLAVEGDMSTDLPAGAMRLIRQQRYVRPREVE